MEVVEKYIIVVLLRNGKRWVGESKNKDGYIRRLQDGTSSLTCVKQYGFEKVEAVITSNSKEDVIQSLVSVHGIDNILNKDIKPISIKQKSYIYSSW